MTFTPTVLTDAYISINSAVVSDKGNKISIPISAEELETTTFGQTWKTRVGGLKDASLDISFFQDYSAANLDATFFPLIGTVVAFEIRPTSSAVSTTNPKFTGSILINKWTPISGDVGKLGGLDVSFPTSGAVTRATS